MGNNDIIAHWDGGSWSSNSYAGVSNNRRLYAVYAVNPSEGYAVGANGLIAAWNGSTWADQASPVGSPLRAVTMAPAGGGAVAVQRWREIIL
ncbi:MAG: hypothetical protein HZB57_09945 [Gammaproteobacteria bacterium]|nr:hypothetical protein [Gammaproteobacteria bacterium]